jgi:hypothetical protein
MPGLVARIVIPLLLLSQAAAVCAQNAAPAPAAVAPAAATAKPANTAGVIDLMEGDVRVFDANQVRRSTVQLKDAVSEGDSVVTGADGELHLNMQDGGYLAVRPNTVMKIITYRANGDTGDASVIGMVKGALRSVTGFIGQFNPRSTKIITPTATIGIRGTDHETQVVDANDPAGEAGTYDKVNAGGTFIQTPQGRTEVSPNQAGFAPKAGNAKPLVLDHVPGFFKPTRNEHLIEGRHAQMLPKLQQLREQRRQQVQQRQGQGQVQGAKAAPAAAASAGNAAEAGAKSANPAQRQAERQQTKAGEFQQRQVERRQAIADQAQKRQAARQQAAAAQQQARQQKIEAQKKALQQKRKTPAEKQKEKEKDR